MREFRWLLNGLTGESRYYQAVRAIPQQLSDDEAAALMARAAT